MTSAIEFRNVVFAEGNRNAELAVRCSTWWSLLGMCKCVFGNEESPYTQYVQFKTVAFGFGAAFTLNRQV